MKILVLGGDGYLGWPTAMYLAQKGHEVTIMDSLHKRKWEMEIGALPLFEIPPLHHRVAVFNKITGKRINFFIGDLVNVGAVYHVLDKASPDVIIHFAEQPSAPFSMKSRTNAVITQHNNVIGNLNVLFAMQRSNKDMHLIKLGTMGEYGTPNIDIEEGYIEIKHKGRTDVLPFPKQPGSFYHLSKVHDSSNILFACKVWGLRATDLNQGVVYGIETEETKLNPELISSFHYDEIFGTVLNRFCVQAAIEHPLSVYGAGGQKRGFLNIMDTLQCIELAMLNAPEMGEMRVMNQFTEVFTIMDLAKTVQHCASKVGLNVEIEHLPNPRVEMEEHYYNPTHTKLLDLGLQPRLLKETLINSMLHQIQESKHRVDKTVIRCKVEWNKHNQKIDKQI